ncbi:MAG: PGPGW domain-containing protein [Steroidobacteraceae bacterium]
MNLPSAGGPRWWRWLRRIGIAIAGGGVLAIGIAMIVLPGPAIVMIPVGLTILGLEFAWARSWLARMREKARSLSGSKRPPA